VQVAFRLHAFILAQLAAYWANLSYAQAAAGATTGAGAAAVGFYKAAKHSYRAMSDVWMASVQSRKKRRSSSVTSPYTPLQRSNKSHMTGHYQGKLKRPRRSKPPGSYDKHGYSAEVERYGTQALTGEVCYVGATSYCHPDLGPVIGIALLRKLLKRHYMYEYSHPNQQILTSTSTVNASVGPVGIRFYWESQTTAGGVAPVISSSAVSPFFLFWDTSVAGGDPQTLAAFGTWFQTNVLSNSNFGGNPESIDNNRIHGYQFIERDYTVTGADPAGGAIGRSTVIQPLKGQYLTAYSYVTMGIQNATPADDGSLLTTHITSNPIKGKLFRFKDIVPRLRQLRGVEGTAPNENAHVICMDPNQDGIIKPGSALTGGWVQIPTASMFDNCTGEASVTLEPGAIKDYTFGFKFNGTLEKFIKGNRVGGSVANYDPVFKQGSFGTSCLFALEKRMPTGAASPTINFHYESKFGCKFGRRAVVCMQRGATGQAAVISA